MKEVGQRIKEFPPKHRKAIIAHLHLVADAIKSARITQDLTQEELAEIVGVDVSTVKSIEQKKRIPSMGLFFYLCEVLKISIKLGKINGNHTKGTNNNNRGY